MPTIQIKHVPVDVHAVLHRRADEAGQSLQEYLLRRLSEEARRPTTAEVFDELREHHDGARMSLDDAVALIRADRDR